MSLVMILDFRKLREKKKIQVYKIIKPVKKMKNLQHYMILHCAIINEKVGISH